MIADNMTTNNFEAEIIVTDNDPPLTFSVICQPNPGVLVTSNGSWSAAVYAPGGGDMPRLLKDAVFRALRTDEVILALRVQGQDLIPCNVSSIEDLADCQAVEVSSLDWPRAALSLQVGIKNERAAVLARITEFLALVHDGRITESVQYLSPSLAGVGTALGEIATRPFPLGIGDFLKPEFSLDFEATYIWIGPKQYRGVGLAGEFLTRAGDIARCQVLLVKNDVWLIDEVYLYVDVPKPDGGGEFVLGRALQARA